MKINCVHCGLEFDKGIMIEDSGKYFCCKGCQGVYHLLNSQNLDNFYKKKGNTKLNRAIYVDEDVSGFDNEGFYSKFVTATNDGFSKIELIIEGIHCSACVWLNEKVLGQSEGIIDANINFSNHKAVVVWDDEIIKLSKIIQIIRSIGYNAYPFESSEAEKKAKEAKKDYMLKMAVGIFSSMNMMMVDIAKYSGYFYGMSKDVIQLIHFTEFIFATITIFYSGQIFFKGAISGLKNRFINMDLLVIGGASLTYIYSLYVLFAQQGQSYFDSVVMIITFVLVGKYLEVIGKNKAFDIFDKLKAQIPLNAIKIIDNKKKVIDINEVEVGDILEVSYGEKVPVDGVIISGIGSLDESSLTGEADLVDKKSGNKVYSGSLNFGEVIRIKASKDFANSTQNTIIKLLENSLNHKPQIENKTNELSKYFSATILTISFFTFVGWYFYSKDFETSLINSISVIIIACPCALALATPIAILVGISRLSKEKIILKEAKDIENVAHIKTIVFDKTGTITKGDLNIKKVLFDEDIKNILFSLVSSSTHPVSQSVKNYIQNNYDTHLIELDNIKQIPAVGIEAIYKSKKIFAGKNKNNSFVFKIDDKVKASFEVIDEIKDGAKEVVEYLKNNGFRVILCSGDKKDKVKNISNIVGIDEYYYEQSPIDKANLIEKLDTKLIMVGDGINDSLALSKATISIAMGRGADVSIAVSDIVLLNDDIKNIKKLISISQDTYKLIKQNLSLSLIYNSLTIPLAIFGYVVPFVAAISMSISSLIVVGNSLRKTD